MSGGTSGLHPRAPISINQHSVRSNGSTESCSACRTRPGKITRNKMPILPAPWQGDKLLSAPRCAEGVVIKCTRGCLSSSTQSQGGIQRVEPATGPPPRSSLPIQGFKSFGFGVRMKLDGHRDTHRHGFLLLLPNNLWIIPAVAAQS